MWCDNIGLVLLIYLGWEFICVVSLERRLDETLVTAIIFLSLPRSLNTENVLTKVN